mgnify:CR=1 FL=1
MTVKYIITKSDEEWLALRGKDVTSTESAALFNMSPHITELELFHRKKTGDLASFESNARMKAGIALEGAIADLASQELGCEVKPFKVYATDQDRMGSSFDYKIMDGKFKGWLLEIKNVDFLVYRDNWLDDEAPDHIEVQCQHQLEMTGRDGIIIACLVGGNDLKLIERPRNHKMGAGIRQRIQKFWQDIKEGNEPKPDFSRDADFIISLHRQAGIEIEVLGPQDRVSGLMERYYESRRVVKEAEAESKAIKAEMLTMVGDTTGKVIYGDLSLSCGEVKESFVEAYTRKGYRSFRINRKKSKGMI